MTMLSSNSTSSADSGHPSGNFEELVTPKNLNSCQSLPPPLLRHPTTISGGGGGGSSLLTKYLVLLQDCVAIKFVVVGGSSDHHASSTNGNTLRRRSRSSYVFNGNSWKQVSILEENFGLKFPKINIETKHRHNFTNLNFTKFTNPTNFQLCI